MRRPPRPVRWLLWAALAASCLAPAQVFQLEPYLQPGNAPTLRREERVVLWQTDAERHSFAVQFAPAGGRGRAALASPLPTPDGGLLYSATLDRLAFDTRYTYAVRRDGRIVFEGSFRTRTRGPRLSFAVVGDSGSGSLAEILIALRLFRDDPDFILQTGDYVYSSGRASEYRSRLFPIYNAPVADPGVGAPVLRSIPVYVAFGNHDLAGRDLGRTPDGLAGFYYCRLPLNGPALASAPTDLGPETARAAFARLAEDRFPRMMNYSFDVGNAHFCILDANANADPLEPALLKWLEYDLGKTRARWKFVAFHQPGFHTSPAHYETQKMRLLAPTFERLGVDVVFSGHVHNYQRSAPLTFEPSAAGATGSLVPGTFRIDGTFDGNNRTRPRGVIYVVSGAGGASLYDAALSGRPERWERPGDTWAPFTRVLVSDRHSYTRVRIDGDRLTCVQIDAYGNELDRFVVTK